LNDRQIYTEKLSQGHWLNSNAPIQSVLRNAISAFFFWLKASNRTRVLSPLASLHRRRRRFYAARRSEARASGPFCFVHARFPQAHGGRTDTVAFVEVGALSPNAWG